MIGVYLDDRPRTVCVASAAADISTLCSLRRSAYLVWYATVLCSPCKAKRGEKRLNETRTHQARHPYSKGRILCNHCRLTPKFTALLPSHPPSALLYLHALSFVCDNHHSLAVCIVSCRNLPKSCLLRKLRSVPLGYMPQRTTDSEGARSS